MELSNISARKMQKHFPVIEQIDGAIETMCGRRHDQPAKLPWEAWKSKIEAAKIAVRSPAFRW